MTSSEVAEPPELDPDRGPLLRSTVLALGASTVLNVVGALITVAWVWQLFRTQQHLGGDGFSDGIGGDYTGGPGPAMVERLDVAFQSTFELAFAGILVALGIGLRLMGDFTVSRLGILGESAPERSIGPDTP